MIEILSNRYGRWQMPTAAHVELDLGCGSGDFVCGLARRYPDRLVIGVDVMLGRLRKARRKCDRAGLANVRFLRVGGWPLVGYVLPDHALHRVHVICPDPWPKPKHHRNRLLTAEYINRLTRKLVPGGILHLATDHTGYWEMMQTSVAQAGGCEPAADGIADVRDLQTEFEAGFAEGGVAVHHAAWRVLPRAV